MYGEHENKNVDVNSFIQSIEMNRKKIKQREKRAKLKTIAFYKKNQYLVVFAFYSWYVDLCS